MTMPTKKTTRRKTIKKGTQPARGAASVSLQGVGGGAGIFDSIKNKLDEWGSKAGKHVAEEHIVPAIKANLPPYMSFGPKKL